MTSREFPFFSVPHWKFRFRWEIPYAIPWLRKLTGTTCVTGLQYLKHHMIRYRSTLSVWLSMCTSLPHLCFTVVCRSYHQHWFWRCLVTCQITSNKVFRWSCLIPCAVLLTSAFGPEYVCEASCLQDHSIDLHLACRVISADRVYVSLGTAGTYPGYGPVYRNVPW